MATEQITQEQFAHLYQKWRSQQLSEEEWRLFQQTATDPAMKSMLLAAVQQDLLSAEFDNLLTADERQEAYGLLMEKINASQAAMDAPAHRTHFLKTAWFKYAAAILIILGAVAYGWINSRHDSSLATTDDNKRLQPDIPPGGEKAVLILAGGTKIMLDSAANGNVAQQGNAQIVKLSNGQIAYHLQGKPDKVLWNTMSTPAGGQYQVMLPDGTKVWLNAASSITYPTAFPGKERSVRISGEAYFEVAKNKQKPFIIDVDGKSLVEVVGTSFNINSYVNEGSIKTTLLEGSVKVISEDKKAILKPGQQAQIALQAGTGNDRPSGKSSATIIINSSINLEQVMAWKNGIFNFNGEDLFTVMRQLERWYNINVQYQGAVSNVIFEGEMYRNANLSDVLEALQKMGVKFRLEGKKLIVTN
ncbi:DUF4974 domain-containing protein [Pseudoflavitalea sp. X16]|uniref:FecR family protein n=1 Tax=Paraflavitalea devenefica TaxID=2716334 RepID=UPI00141F5F76|nr:FecR family protein [Paraflavitalea devenefica]NII23562.1 DUF4974 domain-containing protein [Paraflavitalea devenefica]